MNNITINFWFCSVTASQDAAHDIDTLKKYKVMYISYMFSASWIRLSFTVSPM